MKTYYTFLTALLLLFLTVACSGGKKHSGDSVNISQQEHNSLAEARNQLASVEMEQRQDLFRILLLMNDVTHYAVLLEREREKKGSIQGQQRLADQLFDRMKLLKEQLDEARQTAADNAELLSELNALQRSFESKQQEIARLKNNIRVADEKLRATIREQEEANEQLAATNDQLAATNRQLRSTVSERKRAEWQAWVIAGDELVEAARRIPRANAGLFKMNTGKQSREITTSKQRLLNQATEAYNNAIRTANSQGDRNAAIKAQNKAHEAQRLFNLVTDYKSIGEEQYAD